MNLRTFKADSIPRPKIDGFDLARIGERPLDLEIGAGQGLHAIQYCQSHPERALVAVERTSTRFNLLKSRAKNHPQLGNLHILRADAVAFVAHYIAPLSVQKVFLLYPNPYPKPAQANLRWHRSPFIDCLRAKMRDDGALHLATNLEWYAREAVEWLTLKARFRLIENRALRAPLAARSHFEMKYLARGETCFDLVFEKRLQ